MGRVSAQLRPFSSILGLVFQKPAWFAVAGFLMRVWGRYMEATVVD